MAVYIGIGVKKGRKNDWNIFERKMVDTFVKFFKMLKVYSLNRNISISIYCCFKLASENRKADNNTFI